jgi:CheY-like chemotaxis protein
MARILLIDSNEKHRQSCESMFAYAGFEIISETELSDALDRLFAGEPFDLIIANLDQVKEKNFKFIKEIRTRLRLSEGKLPIITLSDYESDSIFAKAYRYGVNLNILRDNTFSQELLREARIFTGQVRSPFNVD